MMRADFSVKWEEIREAGHSAGRFRVHPDHLLDLFIGYSASGEREFTLESRLDEFTEGNLPEFENLLVRRTEAAGNYCLMLRLIDPSLTDLFSVMCVDLALASGRTQTERGALQTFVGRLNRWAELLRRRQSHGLSLGERLGLLGELNMVLWLTEAGEVELGAAIRGWRGPDGDATDIGLNSLRIEVKAQLSTQAAKLKISSLDQLESDGRDLCVTLYKFSAAEHGISLESVVNEVLSQLSHNHDPLMEFQRKLLFLGYQHDAPYVDEMFNIDSLTIYQVREEFPRLVRTNVPDGVRAAKYEIGCEYIESFRIAQSELGALLNG